MRRLALMVMYAAACGGGKGPTVGPRAAGAGQTLEIARLEARREAGVAGLVELSRSTDVATAALAVRGLGRVGDAVALARLGELLAAGQAGAAEALGLSGNPAAEEPLLAAAARAPGEVEVAALWGLGRVGTERAAPVLARACRDAARPEAQRVAAIALGVLGRREVAIDDGARAALLALAAGKDVALRRAGVYGLAFETPPDASDPVLAALEAGTRDADPGTRAVAMTGLARRKPVAASTVLALAAALEAEADFRPQAAAARGLAAAADEHFAAHQRLLMWIARRAPHSVDAGHVEQAHAIIEALNGLAAVRPQAGTIAQVVGMWRARGAAAGEDRLAVARIDCGLAALAARTPTWTAGPIDCVAGGLPEHEPGVLLADVIGDGFGGTPADRMTALSALVTSREPQLRAAALTAAAAMASELQLAIDGTVTDEVAGWIARGLADRSAAVAGAAAEAAAALVKPIGEVMASRPLPDQVADALVRRATAEAARGDVEVYAGLAAAIAAARLERGRAACEAVRASANRSLRAAGRDCLRDLDGGAVPGDVAPTAAPAAPPHDPAAVLGRRVRWTLTTTRGEIAIDLDPAVAPWHVAAVVALTRARFYDGLTFHRVVPGFVTQGGDPDGTGWGGPGFVLPGEPSPPRAARYDRGAVGIADAGPDTGGSQFFIMHAHAPHLEGRYTWIGRVARGQRVAESLLVGDRIVTATVLVD